MSLSKILMDKTSEMRVINFIRNNYNISELKIKGWAENVFSDWKINVEPRIDITKINIFPVGFQLIQKHQIDIRCFINAIFLSDFICYSKDEHRVSYERLTKVVSKFPEGFCVWFIQLPNSCYLPISYTGWYPTDRELFKIALDRLKSLDSRAVFDERILISDRSKSFDGIFIFNYSIVKLFENTSEYLVILNNFIQNFTKTSVRFIGTIYLSGFGRRVESFFNMDKFRSFKHYGDKEYIYVAEYGDRPIFEKSGKNQSSNLSSN